MWASVGWGIPDIMVRGSLSHRGIDLSVMQDAPSYGDYYTYLMDRFPSLVKGELDEESIEFAVEYTHLRQMDHEDPGLLKGPMSELVTLCANPDGTMAVFIRPVIINRHWERIEDPHVISGLWVGEKLHDRLVASHDALYPYAGRFIDARLGVSLDPQQTARWRSMLSYWMGLEGRGVQGDIRGIFDKLAQDDFAFPTMEDALRSIRPEIPHEIRFLAQWLGITTDEDTVEQMRFLAYFEE